MDTDPNPFRDSPDSDRAASPTEAPDDETRDFTADEVPASGGGSSPSPMSDDSDKSSGDDESSSSSADAPSESAGSIRPTESGAANVDAGGEGKPM